MRTRRWLAPLGAILVTASFVACEDDSTSSPDIGTGSLSVYYADAPANLTHLRVRFLGFSIFDTSGNEVTLSMPAGAEPVDLIPAKDNPTFLRTFNVPVGDYNGAEGRFEIVDFEEAGHPGFVCTPPASLATVTIPRVQVQGVALRVTDTGAVSLLVDIPAPQGECLANGAEGTLGTFGNMTIAPHDP